LKFNYRNDLDLNEHKIYLKLGLFTVLLPTVTIRFYDENKYGGLNQLTKFQPKSLHQFLL